MLYIECMVLAAKKCPRTEVRYDDITEEAIWLLQMCCPKFCSEVGHNKTEEKSLLECQKWMVGIGSKS